MQALSNQIAFAIHGKLLDKLVDSICMARFRTMYGQVLGLDICTLSISKFSSFHDCIPLLKIKYFRCYLMKLPILAVVLI